MLPLTYKEKIMQSICGLFWPFHFLSLQGTKWHLHGEIGSRWKEHMRLLVHIDMVKSDIMQSTLLENWWSERLHESSEVIIMSSTDQRFCKASIIKLLLKTSFQTFLICIFISPSALTSNATITRSAWIIFDSPIFYNKVQWESKIIRDITLEELDIGIGAEYLVGTWRTLTDINWVPWILISAYTVLQNAVLPSNVFVQQTLIRPLLQGGALCSEGLYW